MAWEVYSVSLGVDGMTCHSCVQSIEQRIGSLPGVIHIKVNGVIVHIRKHFSLVAFKLLFFFSFFCQASVLNTC